MAWVCLGADAEAVHNDSFVGSQRRMWKGSHISRMPWVASSRSSAPELPEPKGRISTKMAIEDEIALYLLVVPCRGLRRSGLV
jgi:hypothetical protein